MNTIVKKVLSDFLSEYGKIKLNSSIKKVKLDVGTSGDGPNTDLWLKENNICVIGVEPNLINLHNMYSKYEPQIKKEKLILMRSFKSSVTLKVTLKLRQQYYSRIFIFIVMTNLKYLYFFLLQLTLMRLTLQKLVVVVAEILKSPNQVRFLPWTTTVTHHS